MKACSSSSLVGDVREDNSVRTCPCEYLNVVYTSVITSPGSVLRPRPQGTLSLQWFLTPTLLFIDGVIKLECDFQPLIPEQSVEFKSSHKHFCHVHPLSCCQCPPRLTSLLCVTVKVLKHCPLQGLGGSWPWLETNMKNICSPQQPQSNKAEKFDHVSLCFFVLVHETNDSENLVKTLKKKTC